MPPVSVAAPVVVDWLLESVDVITTAIAHRTAPGPRRSEAKTGPLAVTTTGDGVPWLSTFTVAVYPERLCRDSPSDVKRDVIHSDAASLG